MVNIEKFELSNEHNVFKIKYDGIYDKNSFIKR